MFFVKQGNNVTCSVQKNVQLITLSIKIIAEVEAAMQEKPYRKAMHEYRQQAISMQGTLVNTSMNIKGKVEDVRTPRDYKDRQQYISSNMDYPAYFIPQT